jgi:hypothetical protein
MLSNHAPLAIAEQFGTLESLYPGRIDLGLGRAPGSDYAAVRALRRGKLDDADDAFPCELEELRSYFRPVVPGQALRAVPGAGLDVPIWRSARASSARSSLPHSVCRSRSLRTSRRGYSSPRSKCTAARSDRHPYSRSRTRWSRRT